jgi:pantetheine-phosphate adenylyltransferase
MPSDQKIVVYPGTFDPITNGHLDLINRASRLFSKVVVAVSTHPQKKTLFTLEERIELVLASTTGLPNVRVDSFQGLLVRYAKEAGASAVIRGLRAVSDFEYEFQMALMNRKQRPDIETVFLMPSEEYTYVNSTVVKEIALLGGRVDCFIPQPVAVALGQKMSINHSNGDRS